MKTEFLLIKPENLADLKTCQSVLNSSPSGVEVRGALGSWFYSMITETFSKAISLVPAGSKLLVSMDTPGGFVSGCFEACHDLATIRAQYPDVSVAVFSDGLLASAGYALACAMTSGEKDEIVCTPQACIGSIGVIAGRFEEDLPVSMPGCQIYWFATGSDKIEGRLGTKLTPDEAAKIQKDVDILGAPFFELVANARGMTAAQVEALNAATFRGIDAKKAGLVDDVYPSRSAYLTDPVDPPNTTQESDTDDMAMTPEEQAELMQLRSDLAAAQTAQQAMIAANQERDNKQRAELIASRADLPEATRTLMADIPLEQVQALLASIPKQQAPEAQEPAAPATKPASIVPPIAATEDLSTKLPQADEAKLSDDTRATLDRELKHRKLNDKQLARASYDPVSGNLTVR